MIIDSHEHLIVPEKKQLALMEEAGVDFTILFSTIIHPETAQDLTTLTQELQPLYDIFTGKKNPVEARKHSLEELKQVVDKYPQKYKAFGCIPLGLSVEENNEWIEKYIIKNKFIGLGEIVPKTGEVKQLRTIFSSAEEFGRLPLWVHTFEPVKFTDIKELLELAVEYTKIPVIIGHLGGMHWLDTIKAVRDIPNVYLDLSASFTTMAPYYAVKEYPLRTVFASDAPYMTPRAARLILEEAIQDSGIRRRVMGENIAELLQL